MDEVLREFVTEALDSVESVDRELVRFEQEPTNAATLANIFRLVHTVKGTCGFLDLPRLEALSHAAESLISQFRDGAAVTSDAVTLILQAIDRIKLILRHLEQVQVEPDGDDRDLIAALSEQPATFAAPVIPVLTEELAAEPGAQADASAGAGPAMPAGTVQGQSIRVGLETLESLMTMVSELVLTRNQLIEIARRTDNADFKAPLQRLSSVTAELQERVMKTRMQPISTAWQKLPRLARDLSAELGKDIDLVLTGAETELDRQVLELVKDPFTHLIRNAADHGIETPVERRMIGKPARGTIRVSAMHESGSITIEVSDDGRGLDVRRIAAKAVERGLATAGELERLTDMQIARFIFEPGFTTASHLSHVSGRGVGMDVVRTNIELIGGLVDVRWTPGEGATFTLKIPLTLAIVSALIVEAGGQRFAVPQPAVVELVQPRSGSEHRLERIAGTWLLRLREALLPVVRLSAVLGIDATAEPDPDQGFIVVLRVGKRSFGVVVDAVFHTEEIVVKPMSGLLKPLPMFSGNTILGDGAVILILDPNGLLAQLGEVPAAKRSAGEVAPVAVRQPEEKSSFLVFRAGTSDLKALPLSAVTRLEEFDAADFGHVGGRSVAQYRGALIPVIPAGPGMVMRTEGIQPVLVFCEQNRTAGLAVDEIVDIVEDHLDIRATGQSPGVVGSAIIHGQATEIVDVGHYLSLAIPGWFAGAGGPAPRQARARRVLLVDAAPFFRGLLVPVLKAAGFDVLALAEVEAAVTLLQRGGEPVDVVVADVEAPGLNGFDLWELLAAERPHLRLPIIGLASRLSPAAIERARDLGFSDFVAKFDRDGLVAAIEEATEPRGLAA